MVRSAKWGAWRIIEGLAIRLVQGGSDAPFGRARTDRRQRPNPSTEGQDSMVSRVYVEKKPGFDVEAKQLLTELRDTLGIEALTALRVINRYDVEGIDEKLFARCVPTVFSEPQVDAVYKELPADAAHLFAVEALPGQFDQRAASAS